MSILSSFTCVTATIIFLFTCVVALCCGKGDEMYVCIGKIDVFFEGSRAYSHNPVQAPRSSRPWLIAVDY